jgi:hypothetical protein
MWKIAFSMSCTSGQLDCGARRYDFRRIELSAALFLWVSSGPKALGGVAAAVSVDGAEAISAVVGAVSDVTDAISAVAGG